MLMYPFSFLQELGKVRAEKQELHAQFAREIEAAHAQLSHRETELEQQHFTVLRDLRDKHSKGTYYTYSFAVHVFS